MATIKKKQDKIKINFPHFKMPGFGTLLFTLVFIYILIRVVAYVNDSDPIVFTVEQSTYDTDFTATGLAVRKETIVTAASTGTPCYYIRDGEKVSKGANIYAIDSTGSMQAVMNNMQENGESLLTSDDYKNITKQIKMFKTGFSESSFGDVYNFKTSIDNKLLELYEELALEQVDNGNGTAALAGQKAAFSGIVTYYQDGFENADIKNLSPDMFDKTVYTKQTLKSENPIQAGEPVCKLVDDENWQIAIFLSKEEYDKVTQNEYASFTINDSSRRISTTYEKIEKDGYYYIVVEFNKYIAQYVNERYLDINFMFDESNGLKIPQSSIITKDVYMIPVDYLTGGSGDTDMDHFNQIVTDSLGKTSVKQISPTIFFTDNRFCYVDPADIDSSAVLQKNKSKDTFSVATAAKYTMSGVLCVSRGTAEFRRIEVIVSGDDYCIVKPNLSYGISRYDRILLDGSSMKEGDLIY